MSKRSVSLSTALPRCRFCKRAWQPVEGVVATNSYCSLCSETRRAIAAKQLGLRPLNQEDVAGPYLLRRRLRAS